MKFHTVPEVAKFFHRSEGVIRAWLRDRYLQGNKVRRTWLISDEQIDVFIQRLSDQSASIATDLWQSLCPLLRERRMVAAINLIRPTRMKQVQFITFCASFRCRENLTDARRRSSLLRSPRLPDRSVELQYPQNIKSTLRRWLDRDQNFDCFDYPGFSWMYPSCVQSWHEILLHYFDIILSCRHAPSDLQRDRQELAVIAVSNHG